MTSNKGSALFLILIAVALFAALAYAVTQSGKGSGSISKEQATLDATKIIDYGTQMEQIISRLRLINNCSETQISFFSSQLG